MPTRDQKRERKIKTPRFGKVVVERELEIGRDRVFCAFADADEREKWGAPSNTAASIVEKGEFRVGGTDVTRCGSKDDPQIIVKTHYLAIEEPHLIVCTDAVRDAGELVAIILKTIEITDSTKLRVYAQIASFVDDKMIENTKFGPEQLTEQSGSLSVWLESYPNTPITSPCTITTPSR